MLPGPDQIHELEIYDLNILIERHFDGVFRSHSILSSFARIRILHCIFPALAGANADHFIHRSDEHTPIPDTPSDRGFLDGLDYVRDHVFADNDFKLDFGEEIDHVLGPTVQFGVTLLTTEAFDLAYS